MDLQKTIVEATQEIFESMLMLQVEAENPLPEKNSTYHCSVSGMIGLAGLYQGMLAIHSPDDVARSITSNFLGMDVDEVNEDVTDAIGELANMIAGSVKLAFSESGKDITLSIPSAIHGSEYTLQCMADTHWMVIPFVLPEGKFLLELQLKESNNG